MIMSLQPNTKPKMGPSVLLGAYHITFEQSRLMKLDHSGLGKMTEISPF